MYHMSRVWNAPQGTLSYITMQLGGLLHFTHLIFRACVQRVAAGAYAPAAFDCRDARLCYASRMATISCVRGLMTRIWLPTRM